jgi:uncharacterized protein with HEPN domain
MSRADDATRLRQMLEYALEALEMSQGRQRSDLDCDRMFELAMTRLLEITGEAASKTSPATQSTYPEIQWRPMIGLRNRLIHGYDSVDRDILWRIIEQDLPVLAQQLQAIVESLTHQPPRSASE